MVMLAMLFIAEQRAAQSPGSEGFAMTGKSELWRARSSLSGVADGAVPGVASRDVGCPEELTSAASVPVPGGISKSGASPLARSPEPCRQSRYRAAPTIHGRTPRRSGSDLRSSLQNSTNRAMWRAAEAM
jgi:hypothetical protein